MEKPVIVQKRSLKIMMEPGTYMWCACGRSNDQPYCDGSHKGIGIKPQKVVIEEKQVFPWCMCRFSEKGARCDGKHRDL